MKTHYLYILLTLIGSCSIINSNPIITEFNQPPDFKNLEQYFITEARQTADSKVSSMLEEYKSIPNKARTFENTLAELDNIYDQVYQIKWPLELISTVHPDDSIRQTAMNELEHLEALIQQLKQDEEIYEAIREYNQSKEANELTGYKKKFLNDMLLCFKRHGMELQTKDAEIFRNLMAESYQLGMLYFYNAQSTFDTLWVTEDQLAGLSDNFKTSHKEDDGRFYIDLPGPSFDEVIKNAENEMIRKQVYYKRENIAYNVNQSVLNKLLVARQHLAQLLGYKNYTEYTLETRMAKTSDNVIQLENRLSEKMLLIAQQQQQELLQLKREHLNSPKINVLNPWDVSYYNRIYEEKRMAINQDSIKSYFASNQALDGLLGISEKLFNIKFQKVKNPSVWHPDVLMYKVIDGNKIIGTIYFDLFFRKGKASQGAFAQPIRDRKLTNNGIRYPIIVIGCNFPPPTEKEPSLLLPIDLEYLFHEFGHAMHYLLGESDLILQGGFFVENDFLEVPSQIWENWVWDEEVISSYARHYKTGKKIPKHIVAKIAATRQRNVFSYQYGTLHQSMIDRIMHTEYDPDQSFDFEAMHKKIWAKTKPYVYPTGIFTETRMFPIGFSEYASCYYGFLWADIYAKDMFSIFKKQGVFDSKTGAHFRKCILSPGSSKPAIEMANCFLGRSVDDSAFLGALGLVVE
jgi:thimet oligopeptidase